MSARLADDPQYLQWLRRMNSTPHTERATSVFQQARANRVADTLRIIGRRSTTREALQSYAADPDQPQAVRDAAAAALNAKRAAKAPPIEDCPPLHRPMAETYTVRGRVLRKSLDGGE